MATRRDPRDGEEPEAPLASAPRFRTAELSLVEAKEEATSTRNGAASADAATAVIRRGSAEGPPSRAAPTAAPPPAARPARGVRWLGLRAKFNAALLTTFAIGLALAAWLSDRLLKDNAREEVLQEARIMIEAASGTRTYTAQHVKPLLQDRLDETFLPETVSAYAASHLFLALRGRYPDYTYKEAALNPRNPSNRASDWEADLVNEFRNHRERRELVAVRETPTGQMLHLARPLAIEDEGCLSCHSTPERAPKTMIELYGATNGFGWQHGEVVAAQVVTVPMSVPLARARDTLVTFVALLGGVFVLLLVLLNVLLHYAVIRPLVRMARIATEVSLGTDDVEDYVLHGGDEVASLSRSFHRMRVSLAKAMSMLDE